MKPWNDPLQCPYCSKHVEDFVPIEVPDDPRLIVVGEAPGKTERRDKRPFTGDAGMLLRPMLPASAILLNAVNCYSDEKPTTEIINIEREHHLLPLLAEYPGLPVVSLGATAAQSLAGGKRGGAKKETKKGSKPKDTSMAGQVLWLHDRNVWFMYHPAYYFYSGNDPRILEAIKSYLHSAVAPMLQQEIYLNEIPQTNNNAFILDVETSAPDLPFYGAKMVLLGIMVGESAFQFTAEWLGDPGNVTSLQAWIERQKLVVGHGLMFDILQCEALGLNFDSLDWYDTMIAEKDRGHDPLLGFGLKALAHQNYQAPAWEAKFHSYMKAKVTADKIPLEELSPYNAADLYYTKRLAEARSASQRNNPFVRMDNDYMRRIKSMVSNGIYIDRHQLAVLLCESKKELKTAQAKAREQAGLGPDFNFNSPKQVLSLLQRLVGNIPNTREQTLMTVFDKHPFIATLLDVRGAEKIVEMLLQIKHRIVKATGLVHSTMTTHGAESGRTASKEPNVQNWPEKIRGILVSRYV